MGLEDIFIRALTVEYVNITSNGTNGSSLTQLCFSKASFSQETTHILDFYLHVFIMGAVICLGMFGNFILICAASRKLAFTTNYFLVLIGIADFCVLGMYGFYFTLPSLYEYVNFAEGYFKIFSSTQEYIWFAFITCKTISTYSVVVMLADRYAWLRTQKRRQGNSSNITNARLAIALILALSIMFGFPKMLLFETTLAHDPCTNIYALNIIQDKGLLRNRLFILAYETCTEFVIMYALPVLIMFPLLRGIYARKVTWVRPDQYTRRTSNDANNCNHVTHDCLTPDGRLSSPGSRSPSFPETASRANSDKQDADSAAGLLLNDVSRRNPATQPLMPKPNRRYDENNEHHVTNDIGRRLLAIAVSFLIFESPNCIFHLIQNVKRVGNPGHIEPDQTTIVLAELLNATAVVHYAIKFYLCIFVCKAFKEQCLRIVWCYNRKGKKENHVDWSAYNGRGLGKEYTTMTPIGHGDESPPYGHAEDWV